MRFMIVKMSRLSTSPYTGPTCKRAGVQEGMVYLSIDNARSDAAKLSRINPVGFEVVECSKAGRIIVLKDHVEKWMRENSEDYIDFGEVNMTLLAEGAADEFEIDWSLDDESHWIWELAAAEHTRVEKYMERRI